MTFMGRSPAYAEKVLQIENWINIGVESYARIAATIAFEARAR